MSGKVSDLRGCQATRFHDARCDVAVGIMNEDTSVILVAEVGQLDLLTNAKFSNSGRVGWPERWCRNDELKACFGHEEPRVGVGEEARPLGTVT